MPSHSSDLASVPDNKTNALLASMVTKRSLLGGHRDHDGAWSWSDGSPWSLELWEPGQPSGGEDYLEMINVTTGEWNDVPLVPPHDHGYICQHNVLRTNVNKHLEDLLIRHM